MKRPGFSLVEVIVAMLLLTIALLAIAASGLLAARTLRAGELREEASTRASAILDSLVLYQAAAAGTRTFPHYRIEWQAAVGAVTVRVFFTDGEQLRLEALR